MTRRDRILADIDERLRRLETEAELMRTVLIVKDPATPVAAEAFDGLRKQVVAAASERRTHLVQLTSMAVAVRRATSIADVEPQLREWMSQAGIEELSDVPDGAWPQDVFEDADGGDLAGADAVECVEPAYVDAHTGAVLRLGRARRSSVAETEERS